MKRLTFWLIVLLCILNIFGSLLFEMIFVKYSSLFWLLIFFGVLYLSGLFDDKTWWKTLLIIISGFFSGVVLFSFVIPNFLFGNVLLPELLGVPIVFGFILFIIVLSSLSVVRRFVHRRYILYVPIGSGLLGALFGFFLGKVATKFGYWFGSGTMLEYFFWFVIIGALSYAVLYDDFRKELRYVYPVLLLMLVLLWLL